MSVSDIRQNIHRPSPSAVWTVQHRWGVQLGDVRDYTVTRHGDRLVVRDGKHEVEIPGEVRESFAAMVANAATWVDPEATS